MYSIDITFNIKVINIIQLKINIKMYVIENNYLKICVCGTLINIWYTNQIFKLVPQIYVKK